MTDLNQYFNEEMLTDEQDAATVIDIDIDIGATAVKKRLPYQFVKTNHVFIELHDNKVDVIYAEGHPPAPLILAEIQRTYAVINGIKPLTRWQFDTRVQAMYASADTSSEAVGALSDSIVGLDEATAMLDEPDDLLSGDDGAPIVRLINAIFYEAYREKASDIHVQPFEKQLVVRFRVDGVLKTIVKASRKFSPLVVSRIKVMAKLDIAEKRIPQDGRITIRLGGKSVDMRVSTIPTAFGERVVMRLLDKEATRLDLDSLGMQLAQLQLLNTVINRSHGVFLVTGPTGSGKTTTLYASLSEIDTQHLNVMTVEDPIEYYFEGMSQTQVNIRADMTFARGLRAILRQDPDVVMVGEIRDSETAEICVQASLTGHLVLSTLHTNSATGAITRLIDMGIEPFLVASTLQGVLAQRLVRKLCNSCKTAYEPTVHEQRVFSAELAKQKAVTIYSPNGCDECYQSGYAGRIGVYELIQIDHNLREMIHNNAGEIYWNKYVREQQKVISLREYGLGLVLAGVTSFQEIMRVTQE